MKKKVVFFFPWKEVSGGPTYMASLAVKLSEDLQYDVYYVDYKESLVADKLSASNVKKFFYSEPFNLKIDEPVTLILPIYSAAHIPELNSKSKILFVNWHNYCIQALLDSWRLSDNDLQEFLYKVYKTNSVIFIDKTHWIAQNEWVSPLGRYNFNENYVPVVTTKRQIKAKKNIINKKAINIGVLGRLCKDKIYSVINLLEHFDKYDIGLEKHLYVIGEGEEAKLLEELDIKSVNIHMMGTIIGNKLSEFLADNVDILFGMGLSILEGAAIMLPSVVIPHNIHYFEIDKYALLSECSGYALGWYDTQIEHLNIKMHTLNDILDMVYIEGKKIELGQLSYDYMISNHINNDILFQKYLNKTSLSYEEFKKFSIKQGKIKIFGIPVANIRSSFDEKDKYVDLLGIKNFLTAKCKNETKEFYLLGKRQSIITSKKEDKYYRLYLFGIKIPFLKL